MNEKAPLKIRWIKSFCQAYINNWTDFILHKIYESVLKWFWNVVISDTDFSWNTKRSLSGIKSSQGLLNISTTIIIIITWNKHLCVICHENIDIFYVHLFQSASIRLPLEHRHHKMNKRTMERTNERSGGRMQSHCMYMQQI